MSMQILKNRIQNDEILNNLASFFPNNKIYLVGGSVRDYFCDKSICDRDLIVEGVNVREFSLEVAEFFGGKFIPLDEVNQIYRVVLPDKINYLDITCPLENNIDTDLHRRDLTVNAVAVDINSLEVLDPTGGVEDIKNRVIKGVKESNFIDDPLRLLRIFRFYSLLGFEIDESLMSIVKTHKKLIHKPAAERVNYELVKLFSGEFTHLAILKMDECGLLEEIFPFVKELKQVPPNLHHHLDLFSHSVETVRQLGILYNNSNSEVKSHLEKVDFGGFSRIAHLRLAAFMHDIGKFSTWTIEENTGRHRFIKHDDVGSKLAATFLKSMKFSNKQIGYITYMIKKHIYPTGVISSPDLSEKVMMRYLRKSEDNAIDNILIAQADRLSARGEAITDEMVTENVSALNTLLEFCLDAKNTLKPLPKLLNGKEIMEILNIKPSPKLGEIIENLHEAQLAGNVTTKEQAVEFIKQFS